MHLDKPSVNTFELEVEQAILDKQDNYAVAMTALVNLGSHVLEAIRQDTTRHQDERGVFYVLFMRIIEMLDSASIQIETGCIVPALSNLRIIYETFLQLEYLLLDRNLVSMKCKHFMLMEMYEDLVIHEKIMNSPVHHQRKSIIQFRIEEIESDIIASKYMDSEEVYKKRAFNTNGKKTNIKWYFLSFSDEDIRRFNVNGKSISTLAKFLEKEHVHDLLYPVASNIVHSSLLLSYSLYVREDELYARKIRNSDQIDQVSRHLIKIVIDSFKLISKKLPYDEAHKYFLAMEEFKRRNKHIN